MRFSKYLILVLCIFWTRGGLRAAEWHMATPYAEASFHTVNIRRFADDVGASTGGALTITIHSAGSLFRHSEIKNAVRGEQIQMGEFLLSILSNENPLFQLDSVPFLATDYEEAGRLWQASRDGIAALLARQNIRILFSVPWPPQGLFTKTPVTSVADLRGLKFRAYNLATERLAQLLGAAPTQVEVPDIPQAFTTGRVNAMMTSPSTGANTRAWDFASHYYHLRAWLPKNVVVVSERAFRRLPQARQQALLEAAGRAARRGWDASRRETAAKLEVLRGGGMQVVTPGETLISEFGAIGAVMAAEWLERAGADGARALDMYQNSKPAD